MSILVIMNVYTAGLTLYVSPREFLWICAMDIIYARLCVHVHMYMTDACCYVLVCVCIYRLWNCCCVIRDYSLYYTYVNNEDLVRRVCYIEK